MNQFVVGYRNTKMGMTENLLDCSPKLATCAQLSEVNKSNNILPFTFMIVVAKVYGNTIEM